MADKVKSEDLEQAELVQWIRRNHPQHRVFAVPNGGFRTKASVMKLKATGVTAGIPDLCIPSLKIYIEMKRTKGGVTSPEQKDWIRYLSNNGYHARVCKGKDDAIKFIEEVLLLINI